MNLEPDCFEDHQGQSEVVDYMDIDQVVEVPDTPDKSIAACNNDGYSIGNRSDGSSSCHVINKGYFNEKLRNEPREKGKSVTFHGNRRLFVRPDNCSNSSGFMLGNSSSSSNVLPTADNVHHEKGKALCNSNVQRSICQEGGSFVDLTEQNGHGHVFGKATSTGASGTASVHPPRSYLFSADFYPAVNALDTSSKSSGLNNTVKFGPRSDHGKGVTVGAQHKVESNSSSLASMPPRVTRQKKLVQNGFISPHNIAKSKQVAEKHDTGRVAKDLRVDVGTMALDGPSSTCDIKDLVADAKNSCRFKGKEVSHHSFEEPDARSRNLSQRSSVIFKAATDASTDLGVDTSKGFKESDGWITTHNRMRKVNLPLVDGDQHISRGKAVSSSAIDQQKNGMVQRDHRNRSISSNIYNHFEDLEIDSAQCVSAPPEAMSHRAHKLGQFKERAQLTKRQREGVALSNIGEYAMPHFNDSEIAFPILSGEPSISRSTRNKNRHGAGTSDPVIPLDAQYPEEGDHGSSTLRSSNEDSSVRALLQVEADEMLARELQEQLYNEELAPAFGIDEMDSHHALAMAMAMQQEHSPHAIHAGGRPAYRPASHSRSNPSRNPSIHRDVHAQAPTSTRLARLSGRFPGRPRTLSSTTTPRNSIFPPNIDVDMRMQILEALEAFDDMESPNDLLQIGRDFNENDYEILLALDENNHQHGGATHAQINNLPQSTVQAENLQECAICLETPSIGETIRHLPCLHRFHKDCIDQWLRRKTSCPICKSSVT